MSNHQYIKEGWLMKRSRVGRVVPNWRRRYFRLSHTELLYFKTPHEVTPRRRYSLTLDSKVHQSNDQGYMRCIILQPASDQPNLYIQAENDVDKHEWLMAIYNAYCCTPEVAQWMQILEVSKVNPTSTVESTALPPPASPAPPVAPTRIFLDLVVEEARKLRAADPNGKSDPYCVVKLVDKDGVIIDTEEKRTDWNNATLNPVWKKSFTLGRVVDLHSIKAVQFDLWDHDNLSRHDSLGSVRVPFSQFRMPPVNTGQSELIDNWFRVEPPPKAVRVSSPRRNENRLKNREKEHTTQGWGELHVLMSISGPNLIDFFHNSDLLAMRPVAMATTEHTDNRLEVTILAAKELFSADDTNTSDSYCELTLLDDRGKPIAGESARTAAAHQASNPRWADEHHVFGLVCPIELACSLKVRVIGNGNSNLNNPLGYVCISLDQLSVHKWTEWHALQSEAGMEICENLGEIQLRIWMIGERPSERSRQQNIIKEVDMKTRKLLVEQLELENAQHQLHDAACKLDGARIPCALIDYQARNPQFYGINGCIHYLNTQIYRAHHLKAASDGGFQARCSLDLEGDAILEVTIMHISGLKKRDNSRSPTPYAVVDIDPAECIEERRHTNTSLSPQKSKGAAILFSTAVGSRDTTMLAEQTQRASAANPLDKPLSILSFYSDTNMQSKPVREMMLTDQGDSELGDKKTELSGYGNPSCTSLVTSTAVAWRKEKASLSLSFAGIFSNTKCANIDNLSLHLRVHEARRLAVSSAIGHQISTGISHSSSELDADGVSQASGPHVEQSRAKINVFFTVTPVLDDGKLEYAEQKQGLTVYGTPDPYWPEQEFIFGKVKDITTFSHLSVHVYEREFQGDEKQPLSNLLSIDERKQDVRLRRFQLHKLSSSGEIDDDGFEVLQYGQRVLAFRRCHDGGRFYPAHIQKYIPFPLNEYDIRFEDEIETIDDLWNLFSIDVKGKVHAIHSDGRVDVSINDSDVISNLTPPTRQTRCTVKATQVAPMNSLTKQAEIVMARRFDVTKEENDRWEKMEHKFTGIIIDILSASNLMMVVSEPGSPVKLDKAIKPMCLITWLGKAHSQPTTFCSFNSQGELVVNDTVESSKWSWKANNRLEAAVLHGSAQSNDIHLFQQNPIMFGKVDTTSVSMDDADQLPNGANNMDREMTILSRTSSILIRVMDNADTSGLNVADKVIGLAKLDLTSLQNGQQDLHLQVIPPDETGVPYYTFVGSLFVRITCTTTGNEKVLVPQSLEAVQKKPVTEDGMNERRIYQCGLTMWYQHQLVNETQASPTYTLQTKIKRRQALRLSLSPTENSQIDAFHTALVVIMKRIVSILREIRQFEEFESLSDDARRECRLVYNVSADLDSQWLGRTINELPVETRKNIVVQLEMELLDIAAIDTPEVSPATDISREDWVCLRATRQKLLRENDCFFMQDQTTGRVRVPRSFTGEGMVSWILRSPPALWEDGWTKYCRDATVLSSCRLGWDDPSLDFDPDAIQAPRTREYALQWLSALCAAGFIESISPIITALPDWGKRHMMMEDKMDRYYRLREVEMWMQNQPRENSIFPLDLVQEIDIHRTSVVLPFEFVEGDARKQLYGTPSVSCRSKTYAKNLTEYCDGLLGVHLVLSNMLFTPEVKELKLPILPPGEDKIHRLVDEHASWCWKYSLFVSSRKCLYIYEGDNSIAPIAIIDMTRVGCRVGYNITKEGKGGWLDIVNASIRVKQLNSQEIFPVSSALVEKMVRSRDNGEKIIEFKTYEAQRWAQSFLRAGISVGLCPGQVVVMKQLNPKVLEQKCIDFAAEFDHHDVEGSFHRLLNRFFGHDKDFSHTKHDNKLRQLRVQIRNELKKTGAAGDTVMAYYGKGVRLKAKPKHGGNFSKDSLYAGQIVRIRTPYTDTAYSFTTLYDRKSRTEAPAAVDALLNKYQVIDKASWMNLPMPLRDVFLLYDVEYINSGEPFIEEGLMREHIRTNEGDLDPEKVSESCTNLNILFKSADLESCVTRMVKNRYQHKLLGVLNIPIKSISAHRTIDAWYPLAPAPNMLQRANLGQMRVELKLLNEKEMNRSKKTPSPLEAVKNEAPLMPDFDSDISRSPEISFSVVREPSFIKITSLECRKLRMTDVLTGDPFVEIMLLHEGFSMKEHRTDLKTDLKMRTLNPKWENQEFILGGTESTALSNKKSILLRVMDYNATSANAPLGCVKIKFQRNKTGYIKGLMLEHADLYGKPVTEELLLDQQNRARVDARLLPVVGQPNPKVRITPATEGLLGKIRFSVELMRNESYVGLSAVTNAVEATGSVKMLELSYSAEVAIKSATPLAIERTEGSDIFDWSQYTCYFHPHGVEGQRIQYDATSEDLGFDNSCKFSDLIHIAQRHVTDGMRVVRSDSDAVSFSGQNPFKVLGRTYNVANVEYFEVCLASQTLGKVFKGQFGKSKGKDSFLRTPNQCATFRNKEITLTDRDKVDRKVVLTVDFNLIGICRADRLKKVLADTFRMVGLVFDSRALNRSYERHGLAQMQNKVEAFLWDTCRANSFPGRRISDELLDQVRIMSHSTKLHWKATPQLLAYVLEFVFLGRETSLSYANTVALDTVLDRWSLILGHVSESKDYLSGYLHGKKTPHLIQSLFAECDWTGFEFSTLYRETTFGDGTRGADYSDVHLNNAEPQSPLRVGDLVNAYVPFFKHSGVSVDLQLSSGQFVAATIARECGDDCYEVNIFWRPVDPETAQNHDVVFVGSIMREKRSEKSDFVDGQCSHIYDIKQGRLGQMKHYDEKHHPQAPCLIEYFDHLEPHEEWRTIDSINTTFSNVIGDSLKMQLQKEDHVWVSENSSLIPDNSTAGCHLPLDTKGKQTNKITQEAPMNSRPGKVIRNHGNARYDIMYLDGQLPSDETSVERNRLFPVMDRAMYDGIIMGIHFTSPQLVSSTPALNYHVHLQNGELIDNLSRSQLRLRTECFAADAALLGATFIPKLQIFDEKHSSEMAKTMAGKLSDLWRGKNKPVKVYITLPAKVKSVQVRDATTNKIVQGNLMERSENHPRFFGQYHGYVKGETLDEAVATKLRKTHSAACKRRANSATANAAQSFIKNNCFCLLLAPPPFTQIRGIIRLRPFSQSASLFKTLLSATLGKFPASVMRLFQRQLRAECNANLAPRSKERRVIVERIEVCFKSNPERNVVLNFTLPMRSDQLVVSDIKQKVASGISMLGVSIDVKFQMSIPHNDQGSLADAVSNAFADASEICSKLQRIRSFILMSDECAPLAAKGDVDKVPWSFEPSADEITLSKALSVEFTNQNGEQHSTPTVSLELEALDDVRVSVQDDKDNVHYLHFPIHKITVEAQIRRQISPFFKAIVTQESFQDPPPQCSSQNAFLEQSTKWLDDNPVPSSCCLEFVDIDCTNESHVEHVPTSDVRFDKLRVQVLKASELTLKENMGQENSVHVEVLLVSNDFQHGTYTSLFGLVLSSTGEIVKDMSNNRYPKESTFTLQYDRDQAAWTVDTTDSARKVAEFAYPSIDLGRVSELKVKLKIVDKSDKNNKLLIGTATIPLSQIISTARSEAENGNIELHRSFSVLRKENGRMHVAGNIFLSIERLQRCRAGMEVYSKRLKTDLDFWSICPRELLTMSLQQQENNLKRTLLASVSGGGKALRKKPGEMELQLQKMISVQLTFDAMTLLASAKEFRSVTPEISAEANDTRELMTELTSHALGQLQHTLRQARSLIKETVQTLKFGEDKMSQRLPWSSDPRDKENDVKHHGDVVIMEANINSCASRVRHTVLKLYDLFSVHMLPKLEELYELDAQGDRADVAVCEELLLFFNKEVEELEAEDEKVYQRVYQRSRLIKLRQVLEEVMHTTIQVKVMDADSNTGDNHLGTACIPLIDLLDQQPHDNVYQLLTIPSVGSKYSMTYNAGNQGKETNPGRVRLRLHLKFSEIALLEEAVKVYKARKVKYVAQHAEARRRINAAVVSAQRHRWTTTKGYLDELTEQSKGKLHWERTPILLDLVWDIFITRKNLQASPCKKREEVDAEEHQFSERIAQEVAGYRESVVKVHNRWVNLQPMLEELRSLQADEKMNAQRTPQLLEDIEKEVEGLDAGLRTAWQQVQQKWKILFSTLEELVDMQEQKKLDLGRAPQLLNIVDQRCSKGLSTRYTKAVSNVQLRWMAITQRGGILTELRLMEKNGLHWRRTHELLLLIDEQYEGFADVDARSLEVVQRRWLKVQDLLEDVVRMESQHAIDCDYTPLILEKINMLEYTHAGRKLEIGKVLKPIYTNMSYSKVANDADNKPLSLRQQASSSVESFAFETGVDGIGQLEGMLEWYAIKEAKCELERKPYHRITTEAEKKSYSDARLLITQAEMIFSPMNVRIALEDRGVIPKTSNNDSTDGFSRTTGTTLDAWVSPSNFDPKTGSQELVLPKKLLDEIKELEGLFEKHGDNDQQTYEVANPERVIELYLMIESLGKIDLLRKVDHVLRRNCELTVPDSYHSMLREMTIRQIPTAEVENLVKSLAFVLQKEALVEKGINVSSTANTAVLLQLMNQYRVKEVTLPQDMSSIQTLLQDRKMDHKGEPVLLRGIRIGTQATGVANRPTDMSSETFGALNTGLGIIDTHVEMLRKSLLFEALHKRNSLASTFPVETHILDHEVDEAGVDAFAAAVVNAEVDLSVDYLALVERFQQLLVHEVYTKRLAEYAAQDRCMRALLRVPRDQVVTKEDIAIGLRKLNEKTIGTNYRLPVEAFTREELLAAARAGHIRDPDKEILERCPHGKNTRAMAYYAAVSYAANAYQEATSFRSRVDPDTMHLLDTFPYNQRSSQKNYSTPKDQSPKTFWYTPAKDFEVSSADKPELIEVLQKRLHLASAAFTLRNRWLQRGHGWCDNAFGEGVGVKVLLQRLLLFEAVDKIHMVETEALLKEVRDKCEKLCPREQDAQANLEERYQSNLELLEDLVTHAERCLNKRKMHSENTPVLLHKLEQVCVVPSGLNDRHREAYHVVTSHWSLHRQHLTELEEMQMEGIFNITRIPELLGQMKYHTEGKAGSEELSRDKLVASAQKVDSELQTNVVSRKLDEVRRGQRKEPLNLHLEINAGEVATDETKWKELSPIKRAAAPLSPHDKQTSWNLVRNTNLATGPIGNKIKMKIESKSHAHSERKQSLGDGLKQLLRLPPKLFMKSQEEKITPEYYFPQEVVLEATRSMLPGQTK